MEVEPFRPSFWCGNRHVQTIFPALIRRSVKLRLRRERLELSDGDFLDLDWIGERGPIVVVLHGLGGSGESKYARGLLHRIEEAGWRGLFMHFRNCSEEPNRLDRAYHSGETEDIGHLLEVLREREPRTPLMAVGYSLGANVLLKYLGERGTDTPLSRGVAVSAPFQLEKASAQVNRGFSRVYQRHLLVALVQSARKKYGARANELFGNIDNIGSLREWDEKITAPLHGFHSADHYYKKCSSRQFLKHIKIPTLILHAYDDPFMTPDAVPEPHELSNSVRIEVSDSGGHVGFVTGPFWHPIYWLEDRIPHFLSAGSTGGR